MNIFLLIGLISLGLVFIVVQIMLISAVLKIPAILAELKQLRAEQIMGNRNLIKTILNG